MFIRKGLGSHVVVLRKDELIVNYEAELDVRQIYNRAVELERKKNKLEFKFLRG